MGEPLRLPSIDNSTDATVGGAFWWRGGFARQFRAEQEDMPRCFQDGGVWVFVRN
jgi:hypothetical protein